ncbi:MAG: type III pantothenate kinase [Rikenellaceae bacterium]
MNLVIDVGNTLTKVYVFSDDKIMFSEKYKKLYTTDIEHVLNNHKEVKHAIISSVGATCEKTFLYLLDRFKENFIIFSKNTILKIKNDYLTPDTLGVDRLAAAEGACTLFGTDKNMLIVDFGSAITIDIVEKGHFIGGNISLGAALRFKALNDYTEKLPLKELTEEFSLVGYSTDSAIQNGVINSIIFEIEGYIKRFEQEYGEIMIIFTGGDANYFANKLKNAIFAVSDLVPIGLNSLVNKT